VEGMGKMKDEQTATKKIRLGIEHLPRNREAKFKTHYHQKINKTKQ
jgi:hypothetical protein